MSAQEALTAPIDRALAAYNAKDLSGFAACYAEDCRFEDAEGRTLLAGREELLRRYTQVFTDALSLNAWVPHRICLAGHIVDEEYVDRTFRDGRTERVHMAVVYQIENGLIRHCRYIR